MSFQINWSVLDDEVRAQAKGWLTQRFESINRPGFIGPLHVNELEFGDVPPEVEIRDICDPSPEFYQPDDIDVFASPTAANLRRLLDAAVSSGRVETDDRLDLHVEELRVAEEMSLAVNAAWLDGLVDEVANRYVLAMKRDSDVQMEIYLEYKGNMRVSLSTELIINQPTPAFITLPLTLTLTRFSFTALAIICYLGNKINFCFKEMGQPGDGLLNDMSIDSEIGDRTRQVLKNVEKIEKFIIEQVRNLVSNTMVYPNFHSISLTNKDVEDEGDGDTDDTCEPSV
ncbi:hypothetical protein DFJ73DRAFT_828311 [Zopfochytrium polystomum]|nr:hypothetical protein DFJ73DRAFT_828311 [Zopfochytrium polystomum]